MANIIKPKRSNTAGNTPTTSNLASGELGVNMADQKTYINNGTAVVQIGAGNLSGLGDVTVTTPTSGQSLQYNGTKWVNATGSGSGDVVGPAGATANAYARFNSTTGKLIKNGVVTADDSGNESGVLSTTFADGTAQTVTAGKMWYNGTTGSLNFGMGGGNITQQVGEELFVYGKASSAISGNSLLQAIYQTGTVGSSGVIQFAPTTSGITNGDLIIGVATEDIALNGFGRVTNFGVVHGVNTTGSTYSETWADGDVIWYNPTTGGLTKTKPSAPNIKVQVGIVISAGSGGSGSFQVEINHGSVLGGTDANVQFSTLATNNLIQYNGSYWTNVATIPNSNLANSSITINGSAISLGGSTSVGTVTSVSGTAPISVATGTTTPAISLASGYGDTQNPYASKTANYVLAAPNGAAGVPTFRALVAADIPTLNQNTTGTASNVTGTVAIANGGTGATTAGAALTALGAYAASNPSGYTSNTGTVTSVGGTGTVAGISLSGTVTTSGNLTLGGTFALPSGQVPTKMVYDSFTATASQTTFTPSATYTSGKIDVYANGVRMINASDVTVTSGTSVVFATGLAVGTLVSLVYPI